VVVLIVSLEFLLVEKFLFTDITHNMFPASVEHIRDIETEHGFGCISMMPVGVIKCLRDTALK